VGHPITLLKGLVYGAGLMYLFDPQMGRRRRALASDQITGLLHNVEGTFRSGSSDLGNRLQGVAHETTSALSSGDPSELPHRLSQSFPMQWNPSTQMLATGAGVLGGLMVLKSLRLGTLLTLGAGVAAIAAVNGSMSSGSQSGGGYGSDGMRAGSEGMASAR